MNYEHIVEVLGGEGVVTLPLESELDLVELVRSGLSRSALFHLASRFKLALPEISQIFHLSERTLQRYRQGVEEEQLLDSLVTDRLVALAELYAYGREVLGEEYFLAWMQRPLRTLGGKSPKALLFTSVGIDLVKDELGRIEYGVYS
jgi:putative toxin-antitoxin system antitoxin component (TIGR02293 family)